MKHSKSGRHSRDPKNTDSWKFMIIFKPWKWRKQKHSKSNNNNNNIDPGGGGGGDNQTLNSTPGKFLKNQQRKTL